jgi:hypothetical protein
MESQQGFDLRSVVTAAEAVFDCITTGQRSSW